MYKDYVYHKTFFPDKDHSWNQVSITDPDSTPGQTELKLTQIWPGLMFN